jgi:hypothetical protein
MPAILKNYRFLWGVIAAILLFFVFSNIFAEDPCVQRNRLVREVQQKFPNAYSDSSNWEDLGIPEQYHQQYDKAYYACGRSLNRAK